MAKLSESAQARVDAIVNKHRKVVDGSREWTIVVDFIENYSLLKSSTLHRELL